MIHAITTPIKTAISGMTLFTSGTDSRVAGIVIPVTKRNRDGQLVTFPVTFDVDGKQCWEEGRYFELLPNDLYRAVIYFEQLTGVRFTGYKDEKDQIMIYETDLRLVCWMNLKKFGSVDLTLADRVALGVIKTLTATKGETERNAGRLAVVDASYTNAVVEVVPVQQARQEQTIFSRYTLPDVSFLLYPFDYFAIDLRCYFHVGRECFTEVTAGVEIVC